MSFCNGIAWIFLFEMSHHASLSVEYPGRSLNFPPAQSSSELSFGKASSDEGERAIFLRSPSMKSRVLLIQPPAGVHTFVTLRGVHTVVHEAILPRVRARVRRPPTMLDIWMS